MKTNNETKVLCPNCGTEFAIPETSSVSIGITIGKDSGLGTIYPEVAQDQKKKSAQERIEALREAGVDVSNMFAMLGANGGECIAQNVDGHLSFLDDNDPIFQHIMSNGTVPNRKLFRRWVMAQMFRMLSRNYYGTPLSVTESIHRLGHDYQWKMLENELKAQYRMFENGDIVNYTDRNRWFSVDVAYAMSIDYINTLKDVVAQKKVKKCKGIPYITINSQHIFVEDLYKKLYAPLYRASHIISVANSPLKLWRAVQHFNSLRAKLNWRAPQSKVWVDAYKGSGAYFTLQNMIRFHNCFIYDDHGVKLNKEMSLAFIQAKAIEYHDGDGWRMIGVLKKCLKNNNIDIHEKMAEWRRKK